MFIVDGYVFSVLFNLALCIKYQYFMCVVSVICSKGIQAEQMWFKYEILILQSETKDWLQKDNIMIYDNLHQEVVFDVCLC